jgi:hypothetical protein
MEHTLGVDAQAIRDALPTVQARAYWDGLSGESKLRYVKIAQENHSIGLAVQAVVEAADVPPAGYQMDPQ